MKNDWNEKNNMFQVDPTYELVFMELFYPINEFSKQNLLNFINAIFYDKKFPLIAEVVSFGEKTPAFQQSTESRSGRLDIVVKDEFERIINIEIQRGEQDYFFDRTCFQACRLYGGQLAVGDPFTQLKQTIVISILNFKLFNDPADQDLWISTHQFTCLEKNKGLRPSPLVFFFLELPKLIYAKNFCKTRGWAALLSNNKKYKDYIMENKECENAFKKAQEISVRPAVLAAYHDFMNWKNDDSSMIATLKAVAEQKGIEKGIEKGKMEGKMEGKTEGRIEGKIEGEEMAYVQMIQRYLNIGKSKDEISSILFLSIEDIDRLIKKYP